MRNSIKTLLCIIFSTILFVAACFIMSKQTHKMKNPPVKKVDTITLRNTLKVRPGIIIWINPEDSVQAYIDSTYVYELKYDSVRHMYTKIYYNNNEDRTYKKMELNRIDGKMQYYEDQITKFEKLVMQWDDELWKADSPTPLTSSKI